VKLSFRQAAPTNEVFSPDAFAHIIGTTVPTSWAGTTSDAVVLDAQVSDSGHSVLLTLDIAESHEFE
jgi:hypothetical protein